MKNTIPIIIGSTLLVGGGVLIATSFDSTDAEEVETAPTASLGTWWQTTPEEWHPPLTTPSRAASTTTTTPPPTTTEPPPPEPVGGTRENPFDLSQGGSLSTPGELSYFWVGNVREMSPSIMMDANQFNDPVPPGSKLMSLDLVATVDSAYQGAFPPIRLQWKTELVGDKGKIYPGQGLASGGRYNEITANPDVLGGTTLGGSVYYVVDADDTNLLVLLDGRDFVIPGDEG